jgi:endonuclease G
MVRDGRIMTRSGAVWDPEKMSDDEVEWFANEGTRVSFIVGALRNVRMPGAAQQKLLEELLGGTDDPLRSVERLAGGTGAQHLGGAMMPINHFTFSGPVTIHVHGSAGSAIAPAQDSTTVHPATQDPAFSPSVQEKKQNFDPNYLTRKGYDPDFLGIHLPMPEVAEERADECIGVTRAR